MKIFRYKKNGLLYTITQDRYWGRSYKVHPYKHSEEIGIVHKKRFREFKVNMSLDDFEVVSER